MMIGSKMEEHENRRDKEGWNSYKKNKAMSQSKTSQCHSHLIPSLIYSMELLVDVEVILVHIFKLYCVWILMGLLNGMTHCVI